MTHFNTKHGMEGTRTYRIWCKIKGRCDNPRIPWFHIYGGRGISYDPAWESFEAFFADMGEAPPGLQIDRIDNDGDYCKANCRWATPSQNSNNRRNNHRVEFNGAQWTLAELAKAHGLNYETLSARVRKGWPIHEAIMPPIPPGYTRPSYGKITRNRRRAIA